MSNDKNYNFLANDWFNHSYDYRQNWTPLSPITITNNQVAQIEYKPYFIKVILIT